MVNIKPKKEDDADMVVVMEEDIDDEEEEDVFLGGRRIEERRPAEVVFLSLGLFKKFHQQVNLHSQLFHQVIFLS